MFFKSPKTSESIGVLMVKTESLNVRDKPSVEGEIVSVVAEGYTTKVYEIAEGSGYTWYSISSSKDQWVADNGEWLEFKEKKE